MQVDNIAKRLIKDEEEREKRDVYTIVYKYKDKILIPILGMMDDTVTITEAGYKTELMNTHIVTHTENKILQFSATKCKTMKVGKIPENVIVQAIEVDHWIINHDKKRQIFSAL